MDILTIEAHRNDCPICKPSDGVLAVWTDGHRLSAKNIDTLIHFARKIHLSTGILPHKKPHFLLDDVSQYHKARQAGAKHLNKAAFAAMLFASKIWT